MAVAARLLNWARSVDLEGSNQQWPEELPMPRVNDDRYVKTATHFFLMSSARTLLHEIAHSHKGHNTDPVEEGDEILYAQKRKEELEADLWADEWIFSKWRDYKDDDKVFIGRSLGVAASLLPIAHFDLENDNPLKEHPPVLDRLLQFMDRFLPDVAVDAEDDLGYHAARFLVMSIALNVADIDPDFQLEPMPAKYIEFIDRFRPYFRGRVATCE
tara:strand:+ start:267 stop:911 length:645 start_codon:yes stop_codon:yes gene_type:complete